MYFLDKKINKNKQLKENLIFIIGLLVLLLPCFAIAQDLGVQGKVFPINEPDFLQILQVRIFQLDKIGYFKEFKMAMQKNISHYIDRPTPVLGLTRTISPRNWAYDPSIIMPQTIKDPAGHVVVQAGAHYNPLNYTSLDEMLIFFDADDPDQVNWAKAMDQQAQKLKEKDKLILVNGSLISQKQVFKKSVYFDQLGWLTSRFGIQHVPATVMQDHLQLKVSEVLP